MDAIKNSIDFYLEELKKWNRKINLVSDKDIPFLHERHYLDSISILDSIAPNSKLMDLGSGNGFPSIPISIHRPDVLVWAVEIRKKRAIFLESVSKALSLKNYFVINDSLENCYSSHHSCFDVVTSRAFKDISIAFEKAQFFLKNNGVFIYFNSLYNIELDDFFSSNKKVIHTVNNIVYNLPDAKIRSFLTITIKK